MTDTKTAVAAELASKTRPKVNLASLRDLTLVPAIIVLLIVGAFVDPVFLTDSNLVNVLQQQTVLALVVLAEVLVLLTGRLDLSLESTVGFAPALAIVLVIPVAAGGFGTEWATWLAVPLALLIGVAIGAFNGLMAVAFGLSAFIVTLAMLILLRGLHIFVTGGDSLFAIPPSFLYLGSARWFGVPVSVWICVVAFGVGMVLLAYFRLGRSLYAVGGNEEAARAGGIRPSRVVWGALITASTLAALAGILETGRLGGISASQGDGMIFTVFAAAVIGGVSLNGGKGTLFGALCGVILIGLTENILTLAGVSADSINAVYGAIILLALVLARVTSGRAQD